ncbi:MAG: hypothetical protein QOF41_2325 [Methylobacteriaceae bacterium]|nr:hypothetical protein [Methylobacteriaceae bacterium]
MVTRSRYDELHDKFGKILTTKAGTRYERLAAMVFKALEERNVVIHDVSLVGDSDVAHQIDVEIVVNGTKRRVVIECKDFDVSGDKVGLDIVRSFWAVAEDTKADEAIIISCNGFTQDAAKFAKAKGIKVVILRAFEDKDWEGRIKTIVLNIIALMPANPQMNIAVPNEQEKLRFFKAMQKLHSPGGIHLSDAVYMIRGTERVHFNRFMSAEMSKAIPLTENRDKLTIKVPSNGWEIAISGEAPISFDYAEITYDITRIEQESVVTSRRVAELILSGFGDADVIVFGDQLETRKIDPDTGEVS